MGSGLEHRTCAARDSTSQTSHPNPKSRTSHKPFNPATLSNPQPVEQLLRRTVQRSQGGLVFKAHRLLYHSTLGSRVRKKEEEKGRSLATRCANTARCWHPAAFLAPRSTPPREQLLSPPFPLGRREGQGVRQFSTKEQLPRRHVKRF